MTNKAKFELALEIIRAANASIEKAQEQINIAKAILAEVAIED